MKIAYQFSDAKTDNDVDVNLINDLGFGIPTGHLRLSSRWIHTKHHPLQRGSRSASVATPFPDLCLLAVLDLPLVAGVAATKCPVNCYAVPATDRITKTSFALPGQ